MKPDQNHPLKDAMSPFSVLGLLVGAAKDEPIYCIIFDVGLP